MSYLYVEWEVIPLTLPTVKRNCPKCGEKTTFRNSQKFRVNANKKNIDIWLIYQCEICKSTWNMTIYERINPLDISHTKYKQFLKNDSKLVNQYGFDIGIHNKNNSKLDYSELDYKVVGDDIIFFESKIYKDEVYKNISNNGKVQKSDSYKEAINKDNIQKDDSYLTVQRNITHENNLFQNDIYIIDIKCKYPIGLRIDKVLSKKLGVSRQRLQNLYNASIIRCEDKNGNFLKGKINKGVRIIIGRPDK